MKVVQERTEWPTTDEVRRAAICSYGYGGSVSHVVIEQFVPPEMRDSFFCVERSHKIDPVVLLLSGPQEKRIFLQAEALHEWIQADGSKKDLRGIASTLAVRRDHHDYRSAILVDNRDDAVHALGLLAKGGNQKPHAWTVQSRVLGPEVNKDIVWVFSGHGAQWADMGKELLNNAAFYRAIEPLDEIVNSEIGVSPIALLQSGDFESSDQVQILTYLMQIGISAVLSNYGIFPQAIIGHSVGEIAASVIAGVLTPEEGTIIVTRRAVLYRKVMGHGGMLLINKPYSEVSEELENREDLVAAINASPSSCVVAGDMEAIAQTTEDLEKRASKVFRVKTDIGFHSPMLKKLVDPLLNALDGSLSPTEPKTGVTLYSTSLDDPRGKDIRDPLYWANNMVKPVQFAPAVQAAIEDSYRVFMEISSHPIISHSINETLMDAGIADYCMVPTLLKGKPSEKSILHSISQLHCRGVPVDWSAQMPENWVKDLPNTPWIHRPAWRKIESGPMNVLETHDVDSHTLLGRRTDVAGSDTVVYTTRLDNDNKPFPGSHPLHGTEIVPAACLINTFLKATGASVLENVILRAPVAINAPRAVQVIAQRREAKLLSHLVQAAEEDAAKNSSWATHTTVGRWDVQSPVSKASIDIGATKARLGTRLADNFSIEYLDKVGVSAMGFPWAVTEHYGNSKEMLARVDVAPNVQEGAALPWSALSWAPILDAATSVGSTIFFHEPRLRMPAHIEKVEILTENEPPKVGWLYVQEAPDVTLASHVSIYDEAGQILAKFSSMRFSEIEGTPGVSGSMESLVHQIAWPPAMPSEEPLPISRIVLVSHDVALREEYARTIPAGINIFSVASAQELALSGSNLPLEKQTAIVYIPGEVHSLQDVPQAAGEFTWELLEVLKFTANNAFPSKVFVLTLNTGDGLNATALAHAPLVGLSRVLASEHSDQFGGLIDCEQLVFPLATMRYIHGADVIRIRDAMPRTARLRPLPRHRLFAPSDAKLLPRPDGTYVISGGLGELGLAVADFLVEKGARRLVLISRRPLPPRKQWDQVGKALTAVIDKIRELEAFGASIHVLAMDISVPSAARDLSDALERLSLPQVCGVIHAAGVLDNELALETTRDAFTRVLAPKVTGALVLHELFPPGSVDFFILFSSCGQLVGFTGQSSYGSGNAFLDTLATHRRAQGDNAVAFQWTSWRGMGMSVSTDYINAELASKGITDVTRDEAFAAWMHLSKYDTDHGVVLRSLVFDEREILPSPILNDIAIRRASSSTSEKKCGSSPDSSASHAAKLQSPAEVEAYLDLNIRECVAHVLQMVVDDIDSKAALVDLGIDSVMTVMLRHQLQQRLMIKVPPTLTWSHPTVSHLVSWFAERISAK